MRDRVTKNLVKHIRWVCKEKKMGGGKYTVIGYVILYLR